METDEILQALKLMQKKMDQLRIRDIERLYSYAYDMNPCLPAQRIAALEEQYQISLPEEYRLFLQEVGNGSTTPQSGLFTLEDALNIQWEWEMSDYFREPFVPPASRDEVYEHVDGWGPGLLTLEHTGCGECSYLVVSGAEYGNIWQGQITFPLPAYTRSALPEHLRTIYGPERLDYLLSPANKERLTFLSWYARLFDG